MQRKELMSSVFNVSPDRPNRDAGLPPPGYPGVIPQARLPGGALPVDMAPFVSAPPAYPPYHGAPVSYTPGSLVYPASIQADTSSDFSNKEPLDALLLSGPPPLQKMPSSSSQDEAVRNI